MTLSLWALKKYLHYYIVIIIIKDYPFQTHDLEITNLPTKVQTNIYVITVALTHSPSSYV